MNQVIQAVAFSSHSWRSLDPLKGSLNYSKKGHKELAGMFFFVFFIGVLFCGTRLNPGRVDWWNASLIHFVLLEEKAWHETLQYVLTIVPPIKSFSPMISDLSRSQGFWNMFPFLGSILKTVMLIDSLLHSLLGTSVALPPDVFKRSLRFDDRMSKVGVLELLFFVVGNFSWHHSESKDGNICKQNQEDVLSLPIYGSSSDTMAASTVIHIWHLQSDIRNIFFFEIDP